MGGLGWVDCFCEGGGLGDEFGWFFFLGGGLISIMTASTISALEGGKGGEDEELCLEGMFRCLVSKTVGSSRRGGRKALCFFSGGFSE